MREIVQDGNESEKQTRIRKDRRAGEADRSRTKGTVLQIPFSCGRTMAGGEHAFNDRHNPRVTGEDFGVGTITDVSCREASKLFSRRIDKCQAVFLIKDKHPLL